ncbi:MAG TPA: DUF2948 family protein [Caulobacteraceae bacterium]
MPGQLRLIAQDEEDLEVISAALQDAVARVGDITVEPRALTIAFNRYRWEEGRRMRVRAALQLGSVEKVKTRNLRREAQDAVLDLLAMTFERGEVPGGAVVFTFAGGGDLRVEVECIDAVLADLSQPWPTPRKPQHEV